MLAYAVIACQSESVVHVAYGVWVCLWEPRPYRGFQSVAMCLVLAMFGVRMCPSYLLISFRSRTWSFFCWGPPNNLDPTRPFLWFPGDCFCCCLSDSHETSVFSKKSHPFFSRFARSWPVSHSSWICQSQRPLWQDVKIWRYNIYIYISYIFLISYLFSFHHFISRFFKILCLMFWSWERIGITRIWLVWVAPAQFKAALGYDNWICAQDG